MDTTASFVGIDEVEAHLEVALGLAGATSRHPNDVAGIAAILALLAGSPPAWIVPEATGTLEVLSPWSPVESLTDLRCNTRLCRTNPSSVAGHPGRTSHDPAWRHEASTPSASIWQGEAPSKGKGAGSPPARGACGYK